MNLFELLDAPARTAFFSHIRSEFPQLPEAEMDNFMALATKAWGNAVEAQETQHFAVSVISEEVQADAVATRVFTVDKNTPRVACHLDALMSLAGSAAPFAAIEFDFIRGEIVDAAAGHEDGLSSFVSDWVEGPSGKVLAEPLKLAILRAGYSANYAMVNGYTLTAGLKEPIELPAQQQASFLGSGMSPENFGEYLFNIGIALSASDSEPLTGHAFLQAAYLVKNAPHSFQQHWKEDLEV